MCQIPLADRIAALTAERDALKDAVAEVTQYAERHEAEVVALAEKLAMAVKALERISKATHVDAWSNEKPSHEANIARATLAQIGDKTDG